MAVGRKAGWKRAKPYQASSMITLIERACAASGLVARRIGTVGGDVVRVRASGAVVDVPLAVAREAFEATIAEALS